ncbi:MAG TPA: Gfo/Idh/MocA family oxidoreductase [Chloroflexota bacterium]|nr:Gfo/Idh/MocA family oxidoreductase [Chloroflexota bacterium]
MTRLGLGFAGLGGLGQALLSDMKKFDDRLEVAAVQDIRLDLAEATAERHAARWAGERFDDLLAVAGVDAVVLCTPNALHAPQAQAALHAGKDVLVQKPLALSSADARATLDLAERFGRLLFVDYSYRFLDTMACFRTALADLGPLRSARTAFHNVYGPGADKTWFFDARSSGGGALTDLGVHLLDLALWLLQPRRAELVTADMVADGGVETEAGLSLRLDHLLLSLDVSWNAPLPLTEITFEVVSDSGARLRWENVAGSFFRFRTVRDDAVLLERETTLREDTLRVFSEALRSRRTPAIDLRTYELLDRAYRRPSSSV